MLPPLLACVLFAPSWMFELLVAVCAAWGLYEVAGMTAAGSSALSLAAIAIGGLSAAAILAWTSRSGALPAPAIVTPAMLAMALVALAILAMSGLIAWVNLYGSATAPGRGWLVFIGALYVGALYPYFALLRNMAGGVRLLILMLAAVMAGDSGAYFVGGAIGRVKLMPAVSPSKTVEGALAYVVSSVAAVYILKGPLRVSWSAGTAAGFGVLVSVVAQVGDLAESALKRLAGVKDSGWLFPGHGGLLDRTDSLVFAAVFAYYYSQWLGVAAG